MPRLTTNEKDAIHSVCSARIFDLELKLSNITDNKDPVNFNDRFDAEDTINELTTLYNALIKLQPLAHYINSRDFYKAEHKKWLNSSK